MELYAIRYGISTFKSKFIYKDMSSSNEDTKILWIYYLAKYNNKVFLFDTGFRDKNEALKWGTRIIDVESEVSKLVSKPNNVDVIFITHSHFDHIGNLDLYENASIIMSKKEFEYAIKKASRPIRKKLKQSDVIKVDDEFIYENKYCFKVIGGHTVGSSAIYFNNNSKEYVITGDECYVCDNMLNMRPIGAFVDTRKNMMFIESGYNESKIPLPYHDVKIFETYEHISDNIVKII